MATEAGDLEINKLIFSSLLQYGSDLRPQPDLAQRYTVKGAEITFTLREGLKWHDGKPLNPSDVVFTFETVLNKQYRGPYKGLLKNVKGAADFSAGKTVFVEGIKVDGNRITITLDKPHGPTLMGIGTIPIIPAHIFRGVPVGKLAEKSLVPELKPVGTGPFILKEASVVVGADGKSRKVSEVTLSRNQGYHLGKPHLDKVRFKVLGQTANTAQLGELGIDIIRIRREEAEIVTRKGLHRLWDWPEGGYYYLAANLAYRPFDDRRVRLAMAYSLDREQMIKKAFDGHGTLINAPFLPGSWADPGNITNYTPDLQKSRDLFREAGWTDPDDDDILEQDGRELTFNLFFLKDSPQDEAIAGMIKDDLKKAGARVYLVPKDRDALLEQVFKRRSFDLYLLTWKLGPDPDVSAIFAPDSPINATGFRNNRAGKVLKYAAEFMDISQRQPLYNEWMLLANKELPIIFLFAPNNVMAVSSRVRGFEVSPAGHQYPWKWWVR